MEELVVRLVFQNSCCWREQLSGWRAFPLIDLVSGDGQVGKQELVVNKNLYCCKSFSLGNRAFCSWSPIVGSVWTRVFIDRPEDGGTAGCPAGNQTLVELSETFTKGRIVTTIFVVVT